MAADPETANSNRHHHFQLWLALFAVWVLGGVGVDSFGACRELAREKGDRPDPSTRAGQRSDPLCTLLFDTYLRNSKVGSASVKAATYIVAERGRRVGFWKEVLALLKSGADHVTERHSVRVLRKVLEFDGGARYQLETGEGKPWATARFIAVGKEAVRDIITLAEKSNGGVFEDYVIGLARSRDPQVREFLKGVLTRKVPAPSPTARFHAALGLITLGDPTGVEWLIENCQEQYKTVKEAWRWGVSDNKLGTCCQFALRALFGEGKANTRSEWRAWWRKTDRPLPRHWRLILKDW